MLYALAIKPVLITLAIIMNTPALLENIKNSFKSDIYSISTLMTDLTQGAITRTATLLVRARQHKVTDRNVYKKMAFQKIKQVENSLLEEEKKIIEDIYNDYKITEEQRAFAGRLMSCLKEDNVHCMKQKTKEYMLENDENQKLDNNLHQDLISLFKKIDLDPNVRIIVSSTESDRSLIAGTRAGFRDYNFMQNGIIIPKDDSIKPPLLVLYKPFFNLSKEDQLGMLHHEIGHLKAGHWITKASMRRTISFFTKTLEEEIIESSNWKKLVAIHEQQAEILNKNATSIELVRITRKKGFHPEGLFVRHYAQLSLIDSHYRFVQDLENYKPIPIRQFPDLKNMKFNGPESRR